MLEWCRGGAEKPSATVEEEEDFPPMLCSRREAMRKEVTKKGKEKIYSKKGIRSSSALFLYIA